MAKSKESNTTTTKNSKESSKEIVKVPKTISKKSKDGHKDGKKQKKITRGLLRKSFGPYDEVIGRALEKLIKRGEIPDPLQFIVGIPTSYISNLTKLDLVWKDSETLPTICIALCDEYDLYQEELFQKKEEANEKRRRQRSSNTTDDESYESDE